jgi:single-strand DNA-binding protein
MASLNSFNFTGRLARDPELRTISGDKEVCNLVVAVDRYGDKPTLWVDVSVWGGAASSCAKYLAKGREVAVHAQVDEIRTYEKKDGTTGASLKVSSRDVTFIGSRSESQSDLSDIPDDFQPVAVAAQPVDPDPIPF